MKKIIAIAFALLIAAPQISFAQSTGYRAISQVTIEGNQFLALWAKGDPWTAPSSCNGGSSAVLFIPTSDEQFQTKYAMAMYALSSGRIVSAWAVDCAVTPWGFSAPVSWSLSVHGE